MNLLDSFVNPISVLGKDIKPGDYFYCKFPEKYMGPDIGWIQIDSVSVFLSCSIQNKIELTLRFKQILTCPMIIDGNETYIIKQCHEPS